MGRMPCCEKDNVKRGQWTPEEDAKLVAYVAHHGTRNWRLIPKNAGLQRCGKSCRLRWTNYLRPDLKHGEFTDHEEQIIVKLHSVVGNRWSLIAAQIPGRTDNDVKNHWNTKLRKKLSGMGIDPVTHKPFSHLMAEIASTLAPPQVAHLAEAALGCFKDEMLHLLTKKRVDSWQLENIALPAHRPWDVPPPTCNTISSGINNNIHAGHVNSVDQKMMTMRPGGRGNNYNKDGDEIALEKIRQVLSKAMFNPQPHENNMASNCWDTAVPISGGEMNAGMLHDITTGSTAAHHLVRPSSSTKCVGGGGHEGESCFTIPSNHEYHHSHHREDVQNGSDIVTWKQTENCNNDITTEIHRNEGGRSPWSQSVCSGSTCTGSDIRHHEEGEEVASDDGGDADGDVKGVHGAFSSDCVLWDISYDLVNPII